MKNNNDFLKKVFERKKEIYKDKKNISLNFSEFKKLIKEVEKILENNDNGKLDYDSFYDKIFDIIDLSLSFDENKNLVLDFLKQLGLDTLMDKKDIDLYIEKIKDLEKDYLEKIQNEFLEEKIKENEIRDIDNYYNELEKVINLFLNSNKKGLIILGNKGIGKSYNVIRILRNLNKNFIVINGHISNLQLFKVLFENSNNIIVFDDVVGLLKDKTKLALLLGALDFKGTVKWITKKEILEKEGLIDEFSFDGKVIIILNNINIENEIEEALKDRCLIYSLNLDRNQIIEMIINLAKKDNLDLEKVKWLINNKIDLTLRDYELFKDIIENCGDEWEKISEKLILNEIDKEINEYDKIILNLLLDDKTSMRKKSKMFKEMTGMSERTFWRHLKKLRRLGLIMSS